MALTDTETAPSGRRDRAERLLRYAYMRLTRELDSRFESLLLTGRVTKWYSEVGNEATTVPTGLALGPGDALCTLHRDLGAILAVYLDPARTFPGLLGEDEQGAAGGGAAGSGDRRPDPEELLHRLASQLLGKHEGFSRGVERSFHYGYLDPEAGILHPGMISHLGAMIPVAAGCAFAFRRRGSDRVALNFIGDGGTSTGDFHEGLNMAAVWKLPLVLVVENNRYAFSTPTNLQYACERLSDRGAGYGIAAETVDGNDPDAVAGAMERAVARARSGGGPTLVEAMLGRMRGHSEGDDSLKVVPPEDLERYRSEDPVPAYPRRLEAEGVLDRPTREAIDARCAELVEAAISRALEGEAPRRETAFRAVLAPADARPPVPHSPPASAPPSAPKTGPDRAPAEPGGPGPSEAPGPGSTGLPAVENAAPPEAKVTAPAEPASYVEGIHRALLEEMERDDAVVLLGQDIGVFEGAFRATRGLFERFPGRVLDTPIAESGTIGIAVGAALLGLRPVVEMQFADFVSCGFNQIVNVAAKLYYRWEVPCPLVIRLPSGGGVGAGPFHSQNPEGWFAHVAGLEVVCPAGAADAKALLKAAIRSPNPTLFLEHKFLYRRIKEPLGGPEEVARLGEARVLRAGRDLTLVAYGASTWTALEAAEALAEEGVESEVVDLRTLVPFDEETVLASVRITGRALVVHEAQRTGGFGAEVAARIADGAFSWLDAPVRRVAYPDRPSPYSKILERALLPGKEEVLAAAREVLAY